MDMFVFEVKGLNTCKVLAILSEKSCLLKIFYQIILFCLHRTFDLFREILQ